jgi:hypothetical protein
VVAVGLGETVSSERDKFGRNVDQENSSTDYKHLPYVQLFTEPEVAATYAFARWEKKELETLVSNMPLLQRKLIVAARCMCSHRGRV